MPDFLEDMRVRSLAFLLGVVALQTLPSLPSGMWALAFLLFPLLFRWSALRPALFFLGGFLWALWRADILLSSSLPPSLEKKDVQVEGIVASLPERTARGMRFVLDVQRLTHRGKDQAFSGKIRLNTYHDASVPRPGEHLLLDVRLRRPHGFMNPGGFDYEAWLFERHIRATGYVRKGGYRRLGTTLHYPVHKLRERLRRAMEESLGERPEAALMEALILGDRSRLEDAQWQVLRRTGTAHLMAISGLHVGLVAGMAYGLFGFLWRRSGRGMLKWPVPKVAASGALVAAVAYAALAGFSIPTQRALIMVGAASLALLFGRPVFSSHTLALALFGVLLWDPMAVLSAGFWLSFAAAGSILYALAGGRRQGRWWGVQGYVTLALLPLTLFWFHYAPLGAFGVNLFAIPWVGLGVVPLGLLGSALIVPFPSVGEAMLGLGAESLGLLWSCLSWCASLPVWYWSPVPWTLIPAFIGILWLLAPRGWPGRWAGSLLLLPMVFLRPPSPKPGDVWLTLLDVGQGLSVVVRTAHHTLVYDTGPRFSPGFDAGEAALVPYLRQEGVKAIDTLVLSHEDNDHVGGTASLQAQLPIGRLISGASAVFPDAAPCLAGQSWAWEGVRFAFLYPFRVGLKGNRASCVLRIDHPRGSFLLTGDIGKRQEGQLVRQGARLESLVLVVPHHGSRTSSSPAFVHAVHPRYALFSTGYLNRFGFPHPEVVERYRREGAKVFNTALQGAILMRMEKEGFRIKAYREMARRYWHSP